MWFDPDFDRVEPTQEQKNSDLEILRVLTAKAERIKENINAMKREIVSEFMLFQPALTKYEYDREINNQVENFTTTLDIYEYSPDFPDFWLPSNIGC